jgi:hypothetical protein
VRAFLTWRCRSSLTRCCDAVAGAGPLPQDNYIFLTYENFLEPSGSNALRAVRKFYKA